MRVEKSCQWKLKGVEKIFSEVDNLICDLLIAELSERKKNHARGENIKNLNCKLKINKNK